MDEPRRCFICNHVMDGELRNCAVYDCGHAVHLHCALQRASNHHTRCLQCTPNGDMTPDLGQDREVSLAASTSLAVRRRQIAPPAQMGFFRRVWRFLSPYVPAPRTFTDHVHNKTSLDRIQRLGFTHHDAVHEQVPWSLVASRYTPTDLLLFGFSWDDMVQMGVRAKHLTKFTWPQMRHSLNLDARKLLNTDVTLAELGQLKLSAHQLAELGFTWDSFMSMGADVTSLKQLNVSFDDIRLLWNPPAVQLHKCGFYDRKRLRRAGWDADKLAQQLPDIDRRSVGGRQLRLNF